MAKYLQSKGYFQHVPTVNAEPTSVFDQRDCPGNLKWPLSLLTGIIFFQEANNCKDPSPGGAVTKLNEISGYVCVITNNSARVDIYAVNRVMDFSSIPNVKTFTSADLNASDNVLNDVFNYFSQLLLVKLIIHLRYVLEAARS